MLLDPFRISSLDKKRGRTFDCGVQGQWTQNSWSSHHDRNIVHDIVPHYGKIEEIMIISYDANSKFEEYVFKCKWFKVNLAGQNRTVFQDETGFTRLKTSSTSFQQSHWQTSEPFAFPTHVEQCFYIPYPPDLDEWSLVVTYVSRSRSIVGEKPDIMVVTNVDGVDNEEWM
jgi:Domain of unknown function (DUF4216)